jgi:Fe-S cluster assembly ATP-binding protein
MGLDKINSTKFLDRLYKYSNLLGLDKEFLSRFVGVGMSGGEKKRSEMLQLAMMDPKIAILDEIDSGVDVDSVAVIISAIKELRNKNRSWIVITHYGSFAQSLEPDFVHILIDGKIVHSGGVGTLEKLENGGFEQFR